MEWTESLIQDKILEITKILGIDRMPTSKEVRNLDITGLEPVIERSGGYIKMV